MASDNADWDSDDAHQQPTVEPIDEDNLEEWAAQFRVPQSPRRHYRDAPRLSPQITIAPTYSYLDFRDFLLTELHRQLPRVQYREENDPSYRGDVLKSESCAPRGRLHNDDSDKFGHDSQGFSEFESDFSSPEHFPERHSSPDHERSLDREESLDPPSDDMPLARTPSPTVTEIVEGAVQPARCRPKPYVLITYSSREKHRDPAERAAATAGANAAKRAAQKKPSRRLREGLTTRGISTADALDFMDEPEILQLQRGDIIPIIDTQLAVMIVMASQPPGPWDKTLERATLDMQRVFLQGDFDHLTHQSRLHIRVGIEYGLRGPWAHRVRNNQVNKAEIQPLIRSDTFRALSALQNHYLRQFFPHIHGMMKSQLEALEEHCGFVPVFADSVFTTTEFAFGDAPPHVVKNINDVLYGLRAITVLGDYDPDTSSMFIAPYCFTKIESGEMRAFFEQYFDAGVDRWIEHGFRSDTQYETWANRAEKEVIEARMANRDTSSFKLFSRIHEIFA
ncbi:hypothetical protein C8R46DRAFT_1233007 [Mycena filopes]|nr:hypothetical protein C8R46DRAFT_1233007 [Mycena filopes]